MQDDSSSKVDGEAFRSSYLDYAALTRRLEDWARRHPALVRLSSLGTTPEGRSQWLLTVGPEPDRLRPAAWVDGNLHATELAGSSVALSIAEDVIRLHVEGSVHGLPEPVCARLRQVLFYVVPRISPDGAESVLSTGRYVRSVPRDDRPDRGRPRWRSQDVDGDGRILMMRVRDVGGEFVESKRVPGLLVEREIDDEGPYYKLYPEGVIDHFDGHSVPSPDFFADNPIDLNRNFPWGWAPEPEQAGAGPFPTSEPESRAIVEFATRHPEIFAWLNLHTFGGVGIRPPGHVPDAKMERADLAVYRQVGHWLTSITGYPMVSGFEEFLYEADKPLHGDLSEYAYHQRGAIGYVVELWDLFRRLGMKRPRRFVDYYSRFDRDDLERLAAWDRRENQGRIVQPYHPFEHPQLGSVEVGGLDPRIGVWNPSLSELASVCEAQSRCFLRVAALAPALACAGVSVSALEGDVHRVELDVENHGYLPTHVLDSAQRLDFAEPVFVDCRAEGCELVDSGQAHVVLGHLAGWGRGRQAGLTVPSHQRSRGAEHRRRVCYLVRGRGKLRLRFGACRVGFSETTIDVG